MNARQLRLTADRPGERLDVFLARSLPDFSRAQAQRLIDEGQVRLDSLTPKASLRLEEDVAVEVTLLPPAPIGAQPESIPLTVLYEDSHVLAIDKPAGMATHPGPGQETGTVVNAALAHATDLSGIGGELRPGIVHRLDKDTSGVLLIAKTDAAHHGLAEQMAAHTMTKEYLTLVRGHPPEQAVIDAPIARDPGSRQRMAIVHGGREARTHIRSLGHVGSDTLVLARLETGRTHQIRVHLAGAGHPVVGDPVYGVPSDLVERQFLHAWRIAFRHPVDGRILTLEAPLPADLAQALALALTRTGEPDPATVIDRILAAAGPLTLLEDAHG